MSRHRSIAHTFEENIAAEKARLEAQLAELKPGPQMDAEENPAARDGLTYERVAFIARLADSDMNDTN